MGKPNGNAPRVNRMTLSSVTTGRKRAPLKLLVHGGDGVGKTSFAMSAPGAIMLGAEEGSGHIDCARFPTPADWQDVLDAVQTLTADPGEHRTLVLDSLDWMEPLVWRAATDAAIAAGHKTVMSGDIESFGYGKGYGAALDIWRCFLAALERMQRDRGLGLIAVAHSCLRAIRNPEGDDYERYTLKLHDRAAALWREWVDCVAFAQFETYVSKDRAKRVRGVTTGARLLRTQHSAAFDAKDRYGLPDPLPLSWDDFAEAMERGSPADLGELLIACQEKAHALGGDIESKAAEFIAAHKSDGAALARLNDRLNARIGERKEATT